MTLIRSVVTFAAQSGIPEDAMVNTWHFESDDVEAESVVLADIGAALSGFYGAFDNYLSDQALSSAVTPTVDHYEVEVATGLTGSPIGFSNLLGIALGNASALPSEVALCLTFHADLTGLPEEVPAGAPGPAGDLHPRARHRGRIYLGGFGTTALALGRPTAALITAVTDAAAALKASADLADDSARWVTYSRKNTAYYDVDAGWCDNAFDTQRRRGLSATARTLWS